MDARGKVFGHDADRPAVAAVDCGGGGAGPSPVRRTAPLVVWVVALVGGLAVFHGMGTGPLAAPPLQPASWATWAAGRDPLVATVAVLRLALLGTAWYLVGATTVGVVARIARRAQFVRVADALTVPALRRFLQAVLGASLATAVVVSAVTPSPAAAPASHVTMVSHADPPTPQLAGATLPPPLVLVAPDRDRALTVGSEARGESASPAGHERVVEPGDSLWSIAAAALVTAWGREPSDAEVVPYWRKLIEQNRARLADPDQPDLIFPGDRIVLPTVPSAAVDG